MACVKAQKLLNLLDIPVFLKINSHKVIPVIGVSVKKNINITKFRGKDYGEADYFKFLFFAVFLPT